MIILSMNVSIFAPSAHTTQYAATFGAKKFQAIFSLATYSYRPDKY